ncbi:MAG: hypothetical protein AB7E49_02285 [Campylobacterales bacterium]
MPKSYALTLLLGKVMMKNSACPYLANMKNEIKFTDIFLSTLNFFPIFMEIGEVKNNKVNNLVYFFNHFIDNAYANGLLDDFQNLMAWQIRIALKKQLSSNIKVFNLFQVDINEIHELFIIGIQDKYYQEILMKNTIFIDDFSNDFIKKWEAQQSRQLANTASIP